MKDLGNSADRTPTIEGNESEIEDLSEYLTIGFENSGNRLSAHQLD
jgi:hypothetical protein